MKDPKMKEIWLVSLPVIEEDSKNGFIYFSVQERACLVIDEGKNFIVNRNFDYLGLKVTSKSRSNRREIKDSQKKGLRYKSYIRNETPIKIEREQFIHKICKLDTDEFLLHMNDLVNFFNLDNLQKIKNKELVTI